MSSLHLISTELYLLEINRLKLFTELQNFGAHSFLGDFIKDLDYLFLSLKSSIESCYYELQAKANEIHNQVTELNEFKSQRINFDENGEKLLDFVIDQAKKEHEKFANTVRDALSLSSDPAKLVLEAVMVFWSRRLSFRDESEKNSIVIFLKQLMKLRPMVNNSVRRDAVKLAREWKLKLEGGGRKIDIEVLGFLMFLTAYGIVSEFDSNEVAVLYDSVRSQSDSELHHALGLVDRISESNIIQSPTTFQQLEFELAALTSNNTPPPLLGLPASPSIKRWPEMEAYCKYMDGTHLISFLCDHIEQHDSMCSELLEALKLAPDPAKLVLDVLPGFHCPNEFLTHLPLCNIRTSCIFLLEQLLIMCPHGEPYVNEAALTFALDWKKKFAARKVPSVLVYGFLQLLITYKLVSIFNECDFFALMVRATDHKPSPNLFVHLGLADKAPILIKRLLSSEANTLQAIGYICAFELQTNFPPVEILRGYLKYMKKRKTRVESLEWLEMPGVASEITSVKAVIKCIVDHRLETYFPTKELKDYIVKLEKKKEASKNTGKLVMETAKEKESSASIVIDSIANLQQLQFDNWSSDNAPMSLARFDLDKVSSSVNCWPLLSSFCTRMDGQCLINFLSDHVQHHDSMRRAISDAFQLATCPAKLVLDVLPGFYQSVDDFKKQARKSCILLLEQLLEVSPWIGPSVSKAALKFAIDWKRKLAAQKDSSPLTIYGFLQFIITYRLVNSFNASELLDLWVLASKYRISPHFCRSLGLADQVPVLIEKLSKESQILAAVEYVCAYNLHHVFPPELILKNYLKELEDYMARLQKRKADKVARKEAARKQNSASTILFSDAKLQQFRLANY